MSPIDSIREEYRLHPREESFQTYLDWHLENGFVFSTPDYFVMGRAIRWEEGETEKLNQSIIESYWPFSRELANCWYVHAMAGDMRKAWDILPYELPFIAFERWEFVSVKELRRLTIVKTDRMKRLSHAIPQQTVA